MAGLLCLGALYPYRLNLVPAFFFLNPWDEVSYSWQSHHLLLGDLPPYANFPLTAFFFAPFVLLLRDQPSWLLLVNWGAGRPCWPSSWSRPGWWRAARGRWPIRW